VAGIKAIETMRVKEKIVESPRIPRTTMDRTSGGMAIMISINFKNDLSSLPPKYPAVKPARIPNIVDRIEVSKATMRMERLPYTILARISRPRLSVPNKCPLVPGGAIWLFESIAVYVYGTSCGPIKAKTSQKIMIAIPTIAKGCFFN
jgi:hypothetical protein